MALNNRLEFRRMKRSCSSGTFWDYSNGNISVMVTYVLCFFVHCECVMLGTFFLILYKVLVREQPYTLHLT